MDKIKPQILLKIPENLNTKQEILNNYLSFAFPNGIELSYILKTPIIYSIVLTNEKGINSYLYILLFYEKVKDNDFNNSSLYPLNNQKSEEQYFPVSIIIISYYSNIDFFRKLLVEFYKIIKLDFTPINNNTSGSLTLNNFSNNANNKDKIRAFQKLEFINYLHFCSELLRPPNKSIFIINTRFNSLEYKLNSFQEIPANDFCIELLFNTLEISVIIKLFTALLYEKHIIIIANQNLPLFCIGESLKLLLFPLRWPHTYIPNLPYDQIRFLESPTPYLMGINSPMIDIQSLIEQFPSNIICDVNTSTLYGNFSNLKLPIKEEIRIKKQLLKLKSKHNNNYDEIEYGELNNSFILSNKANSRETINSNSEGIEDIDYQLSFAQNVQNIFFDLFRNNLANIKKEYISGNIFNGQKFLNSFKDSDIKFFFEKLINTLIFEDFIASMQYFDDSFSRQYNIIIINDHEKKTNALNKRNKYFIYELKMLKNINENNENPENNNERKNFIKDYNEISDIIEKNNKKNCNNNYNYFNENHLLRKKYNSFKNLNYYKTDIGRSTIKSIKEKENEKYIFLNFYGKDNFINFYQKNNNFFLYHKIIYKEIYQIYEEISSSYECNSEYKMVPINSLPGKKIKEIEEKEKKEENEKLIDIPINYSYQLYLIMSLYLCHNIEYEKNNPNGNDYSYNLNIHNHLLENRNTDININLNIDNINNFNNNINENNYSNGEIKAESKNLNINNEISNKKSKNIKNNSPIIKLFIKAFKKNQHEFPRNIFYTLLSDFSLEELKKIEKTNIKYIDKTIQYKIDNIEKISYKSMVIMDSDIDEITEDEQQLKQIHTHKLSEDFEDIKLLELLNKNNNNNLSFSVKENDERKNDDEQNIQKSKINVIDNNSLIIYTPKSQGKIKENNSQNMKSKFFKTTKIVFNDISNNDNNFYINEINLFTDPMALSEKICLLIYTFLCGVKIENYNVKNYDLNFFKDIASSEDFEEIKELIVSLKNISLENLSSNPTNYYCFWLNMYNFLTIFSVIFKCEIISNNYEWYRFLKNSYFDIGNLVISLYEMETYILRGKEIIKKIYTNIVDNTQFKIKQIERIDNNLINYGISLPTKSAPIIRIYYPFNFIDTLKMNAIEFFSRNINYNTQNQSLEIPEYSIWIDPNFKDNLNNYKSFLPKGIFNFLKHKLNIGLTKYDWKLNFVNFKNLESNK